MKATLAAVHAQLADQQPTQTPVTTFDSPAIQAYNPVQVVAHGRHGDVDSLPGRGVTAPSAPSLARTSASRSHPSGAPSRGSQTTSTFGACELLCERRGVRSHQQQRGP